jgi:hypothetical protein
MSIGLDYPKLKFPLDESQVKSLQQWIDQVRALLNAKVSFAKNLDAQVVSFDFDSGTIPSKQIAQSVRPLGVLLMSLQKITPPTNVAPTVADGFSWQFANGSLSFPSLGTLAAGSRYRAVVLVVRS